MTDQQHPMTPPPELVRQWLTEFYGSPTAPGESTRHVANRAAQWGADQELEACRMEIIDGAGLAVIDEASDRVELADDLRNARRPKPPSLKEQALVALEDANLDAVHYNIIRRALEALPDD